jgi:hypothetical protein
MHRVGIARDSTAAAGTLGHLLDTDLLCVLVWAMTWPVLLPVIWSMVFLLVLPVLWLIVLLMDGGTDHHVLLMAVLLAIWAMVALLLFIMMLWPIASVGCFLVFYVLVEQPILWMLFTLGWPLAIPIVLVMVRIIISSRMMMMLIV